MREFVGFSLTREDIERAGFDSSELDDNQIESIASSVGEKMWEYCGHEFLEGELEYWGISPIVVDYSGDKIEVGSIVRKIKSDLSVPEIDYEAIDITEDGEVVIKLKGDENSPEETISNAKRDLVIAY